MLSGRRRYGVGNPCVSIPLAECYRMALTVNDPLSPIGDTDAICCRGLG